MLLMKDLISKDIKDLEKLSKTLKEQLFVIRFKKSTGQVTDTHKQKEIRKDIARVLTSINIVKKNLSPEEIVSLKDLFKEERAAINNKRIENRKNANKDKSKSNTNLEKSEPMKTKKVIDVKPNLVKDSIEKADQIQVKKDTDNKKVVEPKISETQKAKNNLDGKVDYTTKVLQQNKPDTKKAEFEGTNSEEDYSAVRNFKEAVRQEARNKEIVKENVIEKAKFDLENQDENNIDSSEFNNIKEELSNVAFKNQEVSMKEAIEEQNIIKQVEDEFSHKNEEGILEQKVELENTSEQEKFDKVKSELTNQAFKKQEDAMNEEKEIRQVIEDVEKEFNGGGN